MRREHCDNSLDARGFGRSLDISSGDLFLGGDNHSVDSHIAITERASTAAVEPALDPIYGIADILPGVSGIDSILILVVEFGKRPAVALGDIGLSGFERKAAYALNVTSVGG